jgi:sugar fermentation stimulation protein A
MTSQAFVPFPAPLVSAVFLRREKRFLAHMELPDGQRIIAHCPNTGSMRSHLVTGAPALLWDSQNPARKLSHTWIAIRVGEVWVGVDTALPQRLAEAALRAGMFPEAGSLTDVRREVRVSEHSRIDLQALSPEGDTLVEVKNVTLVEDGVARFPDAVTERGRKHLEELRGAVRRGSRAAMLYVVQREDGKTLRPADDIDPEYGKALREAARCGVAVWALRARVTPEGVTAVERLEMEL